MEDEERKDRDGIENREGEKGRERERKRLLRKGRRARPVGGRTSSGSLLASHSCRARTRPPADTLAAPHTSASAKIEQDSIRPSLLSIAKNRENEGKTDVVRPPTPRSRNRRRRRTLLSMTPRDRRTRGRPGLMQGVEGVGVELLREGRHARLFRRRRRGRGRGGGGRPGRFGTVTLVRLVHLHVGEGLEELGPSARQVKHVSR